jgi:hypothetical protein
LNGKFFKKNKLTNESKIKNKNQENEDQILKKIKKNLDYWYKNEIG